MAKIPTYTGGTGIKAPRIKTSLAGNKTGAWLSVFSGALKVAESFDFVWKERADEKKAESAAALNTAWLAHENTLSQLYRDAGSANDPMAYQKTADERGKAFKEELDRGVEQELWTRDQANEYFAKHITRQTQDGRLLDQQYVREDQQRKAREAKSVVTRAMGSSMERAALAASDDPQDWGLAASKTLEMQNALRDPQNPAMSQGPEAIELAIHDELKNDEENTIYVLAARRIAEGGDVSDIVEGARIQGRVKLPSGLTVGSRLSGDELRTIAKNIEQQYADAQRKKQQGGRAQADGTEDDLAAASVDAIDAYRESDGSPAALATFLRDGKAAGMTDTQLRAATETLAEPSTAQLAFQLEVMPEFTKALDNIEMNANGKVDGFFEGRDLVSEWEKRGQVSENWATARRKELQQRRDKVAELGANALVPTSTAANLKQKLSQLLGPKANTPQAVTYGARSARFGHAQMPVSAGQTVGLMTDLQRRRDIGSAYDLAISAGIEPQAAFDLATASLYAGGNGSLLKALAAHTNGVDGIKGVQAIVRKDPSTFITFFPNVVAHQHLLVRDAGGAIDVEATKGSIRDAAAKRAVQARGGTLLQQRAGGPASYDEIQRARRPEDKFIIQFLREYEGLMAYSPPQSAANQGAAAQLQSQALSLQQKQQQAGAIP